jgi:hypothetical protein
MKASQLLDLVKRGVGQGHRDAYIPLVRLSRSNISKVGDQSTGPLPGYLRAAHFLSNTTLVAALLMLWLDVLDVRESYPLWPFDHPHPLANWPFGAGIQTVCMGLNTVRHAENHRHSRNAAGLQSAELMITTGSAAHPGCLIVECRPRHLIQHDVISLVSRKETSSQQYARANGMKYCCLDCNYLDPTFVANLKALSEAPNVLRREVSERDLPLIRERLRRYLESDAICEAVWRTASSLGQAEGQIWSVFHAMAWSQQIDIDIGKPIYHTQPMATGGWRLKTEMQRLIFGDHDV